ncbi:TetR/AcrR family transcriptional regulator [Actinocorallia sp. A-T 12471]|uniref:TetR/AcrR family transcriptional regulator n=1 Tax=Actinocorallia sp. A-T 12471 TaxID=3089813 RepID=UPI0029CED19E|nr:TetR/AcrR family transcriptional regulator [Actinocorallia sp. A-T 12471]MDX6739174.1 TetR/AcrR family transcriptional regulator [Actinocorallia sp. A-T 12471]
MPKVSDEHLEARRRQILDAATRCFAREGFHGTSMQDIFRESGLSAGAVYRYFPGKGDIVEAIVLHKREVLAEHMAGVLGQAELPPLEEIFAGFTEAVREIADLDVLGLIPQAWALATYDPVVGPAIRGLLDTLRDYWVAVAVRMRAEGTLAPDADAVAVGRTLFSMMPGFILQNALFKDFTPEEFQRGITGLRARV